MARKPVGRLFVWAIPIFGTMVSPGELRAEPPTELPYFLNSRLIMAADEFKDNTKNKLWQTDDSHQNDSGHRDPKQPLSDFILAYAPASEGQSLQGREPKFTAIAG